MKGKNFHGLFLSLARNTTILLVSSPLSSSSHHVFCLPSLQNYTRSLSTIHSPRLSRTNNHPPCVSVPKSSYAPHSSAYLLHPDVERVCLLLSRYENPDFASLFDGFSSDFDSDLVLGVLMSYRRLGRKTTLGFFSWVGFKLDFQFDHRVIEFMTDYLGRRKLFDDLRCLLKTVLSREGFVTPKTVSMCIRFLGRQGKINEALFLFEEMELEFKCAPDNLVFNNMLSVLCKKAPVDDNSREMCFIDIALSIFRRIQSPDSYSYSNIIIGLCKFGRLHIAQQIFHEMCNAAVVPTRSAVNRFIGELCEAIARDSQNHKVRISNRYRSVSMLIPPRPSIGSLDHAIDVFWQFWNMGGFPSTFVVIDLIQGLCRLRKMDQVVKIVRAAEERNLGVFYKCYPDVVKALCEVHCLEEACKIFARVLSHGLNPKLKTYKALICAACEIGDLKEAEKLFGIMKRKRCTPDSVVYTSLIHGCCKCDEWEAAYQLSLEMLDFGWCLDVQTYTLVDMLIRKHLHVELAVHLHARMESTKLYNHCKADQLEAAYDKLSSVITNGIHPPIFTRELVKRTSGKLEGLKNLPNF